MKLGVMMALGSSLEDQAKSGQDVRFVTYYLKPYATAFEGVTLYSYGQDARKLPEGIQILPNVKKHHRLIYAWLLPFVYKRELRQENVIRIMQMTGSLPAVITKRLYGIPFVATFGYRYSDLARLNGMRITATLLSFLEWIGIHHADAIIVTNPVIEDYLITKRGVPKSKIVTIPNGVDCDVFHPIAQKETEKLTILSVGRLEDEKNYGALIEGLSQIDHKNIKLILVGRGKREQSLRELAAKHNVSLTIEPTVPYDQIHTIYQNADIFVLPSLSEGQPKVALEAMACGLACLVSPCDGNKSIFEHKKTGYIANGYGAAAFADGLTELINQPQLRFSLGQSAREIAQLKYNLKENVQKEIQLLKDLAT